MALTQKQLLAQATNPKAKKKRTVPSGFKFPSPRRASPRRIDKIVRGR